MSEERLEIIKENVYMRSEIAKNSRLGIDTSLKEELELLKEIDRLNNIINELEKWLNEYYKSNRKWYNTELSNHDKQYYGEIYRNTEFMIVKFLKQLKELKDSD